ncbi:MULTISPECIES: maleylacetoacetate isomerase [Rhizobium]|uniref:Maleylacetoacetate isomerase n=1 Tax=Rhizobium favelukesii TaxID=348824 RepID=W6RCE5_9HYPH|nr:MULTISPECIES: maleylacetoacetate isomerase [Rhizobium]MCA0802964.1 maleylacetoacetate isomerase [Rhizobium sp. T1473]MCS0461465.1 maleylacetoacetate isomerase [Rhizobium favelukesii]UFS83476.1 maleylacetoacetate isomerase [Rhizobium sp. T136]CDM58932.1 maleylacetoacetate isomerase [Rhizobium favelukesii]
MKLFEDKISSAASRVRIALALKGLGVERETIGILGADAINRTPEYLHVNPQGLVPALLTDEGVLLTQSLAIIEYLDERYREPPLLPEKLEDRAFARAVALAIAADIHPLLPPRVTARLGTIPGAGPQEIADWSRHWIRVGLTAVEELLARRQTGRYAAGDAPSMADICLFPQAVNAERAGLALDQWPRIAAVVAGLRAIPAFAENGPAPRT